jgi:heme/copper-type cytochrome/quinol oxidase subunit 1
VAVSGNANLHTQIMQKASRQLLADFIWLILSLVLTSLLAIFLFGNSFLKGDLDLHLHDTYFVVSKWLVLTPLFLFATFLLYLIKTRFKKFNSPFSYWAIILSGMTLTVFLTIIIKTLSQFSTGGWTLYPPLSGLGPDRISELKPDPLSTLLANFLTVVQLIVIIITLITAYRWGTKK